MKKITYHISMQGLLEQMAGSGAENKTLEEIFFDKLLIQDSMITGSITHLFEAHTKPVMLKDISKIKIRKD